MQGGVPSEVSADTGVGMMGVVHNGRDTPDTVSEDDDNVVKSSMSDGEEGGKMTQSSQSFAD